MKPLFLPALLLALCLMGTHSTEAQVKSNAYQRCATMDRLQVYYSHNPALKTANTAKARKPATGANQAAFRLQAIVTIPVVVHIVLPNPYLVTDADVQAQIDRLNLDFSGLNGDSTNASGFYAVRGRSRIRFCLARRTPDGQLTNGINRRASGTGSDVSKSIDPIKRATQGGADAWNPQQYLNLWVGKDATSQGILGYADNIGPGSSIDDGVVLNVEAFGSSSCYTLAPYNRGRTATHEVGHYLGLYHIWGDDNGGCGGDDFEQLPASTNCSLPAGLFNPSGQGNGSADVGDTPNQADASSSCSGGVAVRDACATAAPGIMYQNYMDYTNDACLTAFTARQVSRMEWVLENCRPELTTSPACQLPAGALELDAALMASVSPGGFELSGCQTLYYTARMSCPGSITPKCRVVNNGLTTLTSLTVGYRFNNGPAITQVVSVNIPVGGFYVASFPAISVSEGSHALRFFTARPNGATDQVAANDSLTTTLVVMPPTTLPVTENFDEPLALQNWAIDNPNIDFTWERTVPGRGGLGGKLSIDHYTNDGVRNRDDLRSATITVDPSSSYLLSFDVAHKNYPDPDYSDSLAVFISRDCGQTFTRVYYKGGPALATAGTSNQPFENPGASDWRRETISISPALLINGKIMVVFRTVSGYGNWLHLDNISLAKVGARDLRLESITSPGATACSGAITPQVTVENIGFETLTGFGVGYRINNGPVLQQTFSHTIPPGGRVTVALPQTTASTGTQIFTAFTVDPVSASGTGDANVLNDTLQRAFSVATLTVPPITEGFEEAFVPAGWLVLNPNNNATWMRKTPGKNSIFTAFFDNFNNNLLGQTDDLLTPFLDVAGADSVIVSFDVAHKFFSGGVFGSSSDRLTVLSTTDCGASFTPVYSKAGSVLATAGSTTSDYVTPTATDWRTERMVLGTSSTAAGSLGLAFRNTNNFGNNIFLDNISVSAVYKRDLQVMAVERPGSFVCTPSVTPALRLRNSGTDTVRGFKITYVLNGGTPVTQAVAGVLLGRGAETTVDLPALTNLSAGGQDLYFYISELTAASGTTDLNARNDTLRFHFSVPGPMKAPVTELFTGTRFPPANWSVHNPAGSATWQLAGAGNGTAGSAALPGFQQPTGTQTSQLISPIISYDAADSVKLTFDLAAAPYRYATTGGQMDTLEVSVSKDCGNSFTTVYKKWGADLQTAGVPGTPATGFEPDAGDWRRELLDLSQFATQSPVIIFFKTTTNNENNLYLDNIHFSTRVVPVQLKQEGLLVFPSPFQNRFTLWHYQPPAALQYVRVINAVGQLVWSRLFSGNADKQVMVDLTGKAAGVYTVEMGYSDGRKNVVRRVVKQ